MFNVVTFLSLTIIPSEEATIIPSEEATISHHTGSGRAQTNYGHYYSSS